MNPKGWAEGTFWSVSSHSGCSIHWDGPLSTVLVLLQAMGLYREVIKTQPDNIYALNGLGTCLAGTSGRPTQGLCGHL